MYLMTCTRPDLAYPLSILARYVAPGRHRPEHMAATKRVLRYLWSTSGMGLVLGGRRPVGDTFSLGSGSVSWRSTRSSSVLGSSCEAEIYTGAMAEQELRWLTYLLSDLGEPPRSPPVLTKHIALRYFLARELQQRGQLRLAYVASEANTTDIFTKALPPGDHQRFCTMLGLLVLFCLTDLLALLCLTGLVTSCSPPLCLWGFSYLYPTHLLVHSFLIILIGAASGGAEPGGAGSEGAGSGGAEPEGEEPGGESAFVCPPSVGGECALSTDVLEDRQEEFQCFAAALPHLVSLLLAPEGDPDAPDIPTPRSYTEAIEGPYSSQWQAAMDAEMAFRKSTGTYIERGSPTWGEHRQWHGVDYFQTFSPTPKMTTLPVLLHVAAQRDYELHLVYVDDLVFAMADTAGLAHVKSELQKRHTCTDLGELRSYLGLQITRDRARRTITLTQSHMVQQVLQRFYFTNSSPQATPLSTCHSLSALPLDESIEPRGPYPELVGCLMYLMTCTRPDLAYPLSILARYVAPGRHRPEHMADAKRVLRYLCSTSGTGLVL
ncbi:unnamed protein product [Closterium sp. NIES-53]